VPLAHLKELVGNHPILVATTAASSGVLLGAYVAVQLFASPAQIGPAASAPQQVAETTGSAPPKDDIAAADRCAGQTWPYLSRDCTVQMQSNRRAARVIAPDRLDKPVETPAANSPATSSTASNAAPAVPPAAPWPSAPNTTAANTPPAPATAVPVAAPTDPQDVAGANAVMDSAGSKAAEKRRIKEAKRKAKKLKTDPKSDEADDKAVVLTTRDDRDEEGRADRTDRRSLRAESRERRVVVDRDDDDDASSARDGRRVIVIRRESRDGFGGIFGNLFGN